jgi:hypothetical protein
MTTKKEYEKNGIFSILDATTINTLVTIGYIQEFVFVNVFLLFI